MIYWICDLGNITQILRLLLCKMEILFHKSLIRISTQ